MVGITEISAIVAAAGVSVGVVYYVLDMRNQNKVRQMDMIMRLYSHYCSEEYSKASGRYMATEFKDFEDFQQKYGVVGEHPVTTAFYIVPTFFEGVGALLKRKLTNIELLHELFAVKMHWKKIEPIIEDVRKHFEEPRLFENFEYLYNETEKYEKKLQQSKA
ncbi:MAG: hypothetical protein OEX77_08710 [Candidatus Bathyarchaeota archaeon]|nr:hypothetical protein [Candidatus Bathyarchaeota archaeon]